ncbi:MAG: nuclear transport factor 2 family protein, partial [Aurantimonas coralicida]|nr:nuclear transport factor 2 family protein [Aurantimonas coralicida]
MSETIERPVTAEPSAARAAAAGWLSAFENALAAGDIDAAAELFAETSFWRDLVTFTWNIKTVEGPAGVRDMLAAQLGATGPRGFALSEEPTEDGGVTTAWFVFETEVARGEGVLRLKNGRAWTLLTAMTELKGFEEPSHDRRPAGAEHGAAKNRKSWLERREEEARTLGY